MEINELVEAAQNIEVFDFAEVVQGRGYPEDTVEVFLDEATAYKIQVLREQQSRESDPDKVDQIEGQISALWGELEKSKYVFKITGVSTEDREKLVEQAESEIPEEFENRRNPFTQNLERSKKPDPKRDAARDRLFTNLVWQAHIKQIVAPNGAVQNDPPLEAIEALRKIPMAQLQKLATAIDKLQVAADAFEQATDEDFLAKS